MKTILPLGFLVVAAVLFPTPNAHALQVTYNVVQTGMSGDFNFGAGESRPNSLNESFGTNVSSFQVTGSVEPARAGLIGARTGFRASAFRALPEVFPVLSAVKNTTSSLFDFDDEEVDPLDDGGEVFGWSQINIDTSAAGRFETTAQINGLTDTNDIGFVQFDWAVTGVSSIFVDVSGLISGDATVTRASSIARLEAVGIGSSEPIPDVFIHSPTVASDGSIDDTIPGALELQSFLVPFDQLQLDSGEVPLFSVDFEFAVETSLELTSASGLGAFSSIFDANFSNTATLTNVTILDSQQIAIEGVSVVDRFTQESLVASTVPEPSAAIVLLLAGCAGAIGRRRIS